MLSLLLLAAAPVPAVDTMLQRAGVINDIDELERFHHIYGWQQDYMLFQYQVDMTMDETPSVFRYKYGVYRGKVGAKRVWVDHPGGFTGFAGMPVFGALIAHHQAQGIITVAPDRQTARARFRTSTGPFMSRNGRGLVSASQVSEGADQSVGYELAYAREKGVWKLSSFQVCIYAEGALASGYADLPVPGRMGAPADAGPDWWDSRTRVKPLAVEPAYPASPIGPDEVETPAEHGCFNEKSQAMVHSVVQPFHYANPVTGKAVTWVNK